jgi:hypothetical protein
MKNVKDPVPFYGATGQKIAQLLDIEPWQSIFYLFDFKNLLNQWPGYRKISKGDNFPMSRAQEAAFQLAPQLRGRIVVMCGRLVEKAFGEPAVPFFTWVPGDFKHAVIPHPSGMNRFWNIPENVDHARKFLRSLPIDPADVARAARIKEIARTLPQRSLGNSEFQRLCGEVAEKN